MAYTKEMYNLEFVLKLPEYKHLKSVNNLKNQMIDV